MTLLKALYGTPNNPIGSTHDFAHRMIERTPQVGGCDRPITLVHETSGDVFQDFGGGPSLLLDLTRRH
jgi:hypothetical protein